MLSENRDMSLKRGFVSEKAMRTIVKFGTGLALELKARNKQAIR